ncbi:MAG: CoA-binding protein [Candidatus ainarchaeum sp.]|nr:CoA-binding protein [Candidatus ainarchaeum sp.]
MSYKIKNLKFVFEPKSVALIGASSTHSKLGNVILKNLVEGGFEGKIYPVNPKYTSIMNMRCYSSVLDIKDKVDCAIISIPAIAVPKSLEECGKKGVKGVIVLSGGFGESGNKILEEEVKNIANKYSIALIGPNCLGVFNPYKKLDSIFFPVYKLERPKQGSFSFITQSGGVGSCVIDLAAHFGVGLSKFISYGNAAVVDESDLLEFLESDKKTKQILLYIEGVKDGKKLLSTLTRVNRKKPVIVLKAGKGQKASKAAFSHTGNIAGNYLAYDGAFKQSKVVVADSLEELFDFVKIFHQTLPKGDKIGVITNGGGIGVLAVDEIEKEKLILSDFSEETSKKLREFLPSYATVSNPLDIIADANPSIYEKSLELMLSDKNIDCIIIIVLFQAPSLDDRLLNILIKASDDRRKPIAVVAVGGDYTIMQRKTLDSYGVPTYRSPSDAVKAMKKLIDYAKYSGCRECINPKKIKPEFKLTE